MIRKLIPALQNKDKKKKKAGQRALSSLKRDNPYFKP
jgi:hypothetical protein